MEKSNFSKRFWGIVFAITFLVSVGAVAKALAAGGAIQEKNLEALPTQSAKPTSPDALTPSSPSDTDVATASNAGKDFSSGAGNIGKGFVKGAKVTGRAFKTAGNTMARGFKKAGHSIRDYFLGKKDNEVQEDDLGSQPAVQESSARDPVSSQLDAVGNDMPRKAEPRNLSKKSKSASSEVD